MRKISLREFSGSQSADSISTTDVLTFARVQLSGLLPSSAGIRKKEIGSEDSFLLKTELKCTF